MRALNLRCSRGSSALHTLSMTSWLMLFQLTPSEARSRWDDV